MQGTFSQNGSPDITIAGLKARVFSDRSESAPKVAKNESSIINEVERSVDFGDLQKKISEYENFLPKVETLKRETEELEKSFYESRNQPKFVLQRLVTQITTKNEDLAKSEQKLEVLTDKMTGDVKDILNRAKDQIDLSLIFGFLDKNISNQNLRDNLLNLHTREVLARYFKKKSPNAEVKEISAKDANISLKEERDSTAANMEEIKLDPAINDSFLVDTGKFEEAEVGDGERTLEGEMTPKADLAVKQDDRAEQQNPVTHDSKIDESRGNLPVDYGFDFDKEEAKKRLDQKSKIAESGQTQDQVEGQSIEAPIQAMQDMVTLYPDDREPKKEEIVVSDASLEPHHEKSNVQSENQAVLHTGGQERIEEIKDSLRSSLLTKLPESPLKKEGQPEPATQDVITEKLKSEPVEEVEKNEAIIQEKPIEKAPVMQAVALEKTKPEVVSAPREVAGPAKSQQEDLGDPKSKNFMSGLWDRFSSKKIVDSSSVSKLSDAVVNARAKSIEKN